jgi:hypothetical protein
MLMWQFFLASLTSRSSILWKSTYYMIKRAILENQKSRKIIYQILAKTATIRPPLALVRG